MLTENKLVVAQGYWFRKQEGENINGYGVSLRVDENVLELMVVDDCSSVNTLKTIELYTLNWVSCLKCNLYPNKAIVRKLL